MSLSHAIAPDADGEEDDEEEVEDGRAFCLSLLEDFFLGPTMSTRQPPPVDAAPIPPPPTATLPLSPSGSASGPEAANNDRPLRSAWCAVLRC